ncbi:hypothetical protein G3570_07350 [Balneolaceae bacterium YR4-1]|uniref:Surface antigen n=1 Tax=Halalkalibaculum roseum TaxID=2709311 RepID=A0A6M1SUD1_9BACT|nr:hypothetical protein [Halalkalibaculum roseum]NGP76442.1 hypothetical protein [Halalkalibaculum roseum]
MDNFNLKNFSIGWISLLIVAICTIMPQEVAGQESGKSYELLPAPDLWYNDVDGIRVGFRVKGQVPGSFDDGPHRLDLGLWLATWFPETPVSYFVSFTEPIASISDFGSEGNIQLFSSIRTGYHRHGLSFNKRWQTGFNEQNFKELSVSFSAEDRFESEYLLYPQLWQNDWLYMVGIQFSVQDQNKLGRYVADLSNSINTFGSEASFIRSRFQFQQLVDIGKGFSIRSRLFAGISSNKTANQYLFSHSFKPAIGWMDNGLTRAKGTIPTNWMEEGVFQVSGGANLRGYLNQDFEALNQGSAPIYTSMGAINLELDYPNPLDKAIGNIPVVGSVLKLRSYLFFDSGTSLGLTDFEEDRILSDAGLGFMFSLNIPDYLGKSRGIRIRYDLPLWLSNPGDENHIKFRNIIGIGAVFSL